MKDLIFVNSHPIQYFAPLYKYLNEQGIKTQAWYGSDESISGGMDRQFGTEVKWDIPLLQGYQYQFFKNYSWKPSHFNGFFGLINLGMVKMLFKIPKSVIVVHGWHYFSHFFIIMLGKMCGHTVCLRCELPENQQLMKIGFKQSVKHFLLRNIIFPRASFFLNIGTQNKLFYKSHGIEDDKIVFCPYSVDNDRFRQDESRLIMEIVSIRERLGIPEQDKVILYSGKYIKKKRPMDVINAFFKLNQPNCWLIMVGEGELRQEMEAKITEYKSTKVLLTGFVNQSQIAEYYAISDVFVMSSTVGETWGLSVNEAMNFNLPLVISDITGCSNDLVKEGANGYIYKTGDIQELSEKLNDILFNNKLTGSSTSKEIVDVYSYDTIAKNIRSLVS
jgi:glycosyltransferase involved in cell wall biosynthesis